MNAETIRRLENFIRLGRIKTVTPSSPYHCVTVNLGDIVTKELRVLNLRAGNDSTHDLPSINEECIVLSPCGVIELGVVLVGLNNEDFPTLSLDPNIKLRVFEDGAVISYDTKNHILQAILPEGGSAKLVANVEIDGKLHVTQDITTDADVKAGNISLKNHKTSGVKGGGDTSGGPVP
ncbi:phage baseplate assembly protein V [Acinetobacter ursingii]|uniref:phage baseplate assembly protein V n=1 Tax=Acinetobacter ursingii TaxID=108980 RepID=UPI0012505A55|nr:phage baseplate assembly protein V [Acinetobacter ursingii]MCU4482247.1 phage baseplate assembly protein V [Acinetobacter ursingii]MCU4506444.1 phage baseplate assembly protein V [Acinetobacter ursingii]